MTFDESWFTGKHFVTKINSSLLCIGTDRPNFLYGIEIIDDDITPMEFVVTVLKTNLELKEEDVTGAMLAVHVHGRAVIAVKNKENAFRISERIVIEARKNNYPLVCLPYCVQQDAPADAEKRCG